MSSPAEVIAAAQQLTPEQLARLDDQELRELELLVGNDFEAKVDERCEQDPLYWAENWTLTENPHYQEQGLPFKGPFPKKSYFRPLFQAFAEHARLFVPKSREMLTSWAVVAYATHRAQWEKAEVVIQTAKEEKAKRLCEYAAILYRNQAEWLKRRHPLKRDATSLALEWADGGKLFGIPSGEDQIRVYHPTIVIFDEASFLPGIEACYDATEPVSKQIIAISSAAPGWFADQVQSREVAAKAGGEKMKALDVDNPPKAEVPAGGVGPQRWMRCKLHGEEFSVVWVDSLAFWFGDCPRCKPEDHVPEKPAPPKHQPAYEWLSKEETP